jgi:hypothetical protein
MTGRVRRSVERRERKRKKKKDLQQLNYVEGRWNGYADGRKEQAHKFVWQ